MHCKTLPLLLCWFSFHLCNTWHFFPIFFTHASLICSPILKIKISFSLFIWHPKNILVSYSPCFSLQCNFRNNKLYFRSTLLSSLSIIYTATPLITMSFLFSTFIPRTIFKKSIRTFFFYFRLPSESFIFFFLNITKCSPRTDLTCQT